MTGWNFKIWCRSQTKRAIMDRMVDDIVSAALLGDGYSCLPGTVTLGQFADVIKSAKAECILLGVQDAVEWLTKDNTLAVLVSMTEIQVTRKRFSTGGVVGKSIGNSVGKFIDQQYIAIDIPQSVSDQGNEIPFSGDVVSYKEADNDGGVATLPGVRKTPRTKRKPSKPRYDGPWNIILINDDYHSFHYVIKMLQELFKYDQRQATVIAKQVDRDGRGICFTTHKELAELKQEQITAYGRDSLVASCKGSMTSVIERAA